MHIKVAVRSFNDLNVTIKVRESQMFCGTLYIASRPIYLGRCDSLICSCMHYILCASHWNQRKLDTTCHWQVYDKLELYE